jgi:hypothetical protein
MGVGGCSDHDRMVVRFVGTYASSNNIYQIIRVHLAMSGIRIQNVSGDSYCLHRYQQIELPYDHDHYSPPPPSPQ